MATTRRTAKPTTGAKRSRVLPRPPKEGGERSNWRGQVQDFPTPKQADPTEAEATPTGSEGVPPVSPDAPRQGQEWLTPLELAGRMRVKRRAVDSWRHDGAPTEIRNGVHCFPWPDVLLWWRSNVRLGGRPAHGEETDLEAAKARRAIADARLAELDVAQRERQLLPLAEVDRQVSDLLMRLQARLLTVPSKYAARVVNVPTVGAAMAVLDSAVQEVLAELSVAMDATDDLEDAA